VRIDCRGGLPALGAAVGGGAQVVAAVAAMAAGVSESFIESPDEKANLEDGEDGGERGEEPEGDDQVPEHAVLAVKSAEVHAGEFETFERMVPVFADLAAEGEAVGMSEDPVSRRGFADGDVVGEFEAGAGDVMAAIPEDDGGEADQEAQR